MENKGLTVTKLNDRDYMILDEDIQMYLLLGSERAMLVDTGFGMSDLPELVKELTDLPLIVVNTHGHYDHAAGTPQFGKAYTHEAEHALIKASVKGEYELYPVKEGDKFDIGGRVFEAVEIPGHRPGAIALLERSERLIVTGDNVVTTPVVMYMDDADVRVLLESEKKLASMRDAFDTIYPGHGGAPISPAQIDCMIDCIEKYLEGGIKGEPAVGPEGTKCVCYAYGGASLYCPE